MLGKIGSALLCAALACIMLAGCGGDSGDKGAATLQSPVAKGGTAGKYGPKEARVVPLGTPPEVRRIDGEAAGMVWLNDSIYGITMANDRDLVKLSIKGKKIELAKESLRLGRNSFLDGTDGTQIFYKNDTRHHVLKDGKDGGIIYDVEVGRFTPFPGGQEGFLWYDNAEVHKVKLENGKITSVDETEWLKSHSMDGGMNHIVISGEAVFMAGFMRKDGKNQPAVFEFTMDGTQTRIYGEGTPAFRNGIYGLAVTKDYVVVADDTKEVRIFSRSDGQFIGSFSCEALKFPNHPDCLVQISDNLLLAHQYSSTSSFTLISL